MAADRSDEDVDLDELINDPKALLAVSAWRFVDIAHFVEIWSYNKHATYAFTAKSLHNLANNGDES